MDGMHVCLTLPASMHVHAGVAIFHINPRFLPASGARNLGFNVDISSLCAWSHHILYPGLSLVVVYVACADHRPIHSCLTWTGSLWTIQDFHDVVHIFHDQRVTMYGLKAGSFSYCLYGEWIIDIRLWKGDVNYIWNRVSVHVLMYIAIKSHHGYFSLFCATHWIRHIL